MSVTLKPNNMKYRDPDTGNYKGVDVIAERTTTEQIAEIRSAGTAQKNQIQQKGEQTLATIPSEYTQMYDDLNVVRDDLAPVYDATSTYAVGDLVTHDYQLYKCKTAIETAEAWTVAHWQIIDVDNLNKGIISEIDNVKNDLNETQIVIYSKNRFDVSKIEKGYVNQANGAWVGNATSTYSGTPDLIETESVPFVVTVYRLGAGSANIGMRYAVYDEEGDYITGAVLSLNDFTFVQHPTESNQFCGYITFNNPNIKYIRFSMLTGFFSTLPVQIESGALPTAYTPYTGDVKRALDVPTLESGVVGYKGNSVYFSSITSNATVKLGIENSIKKNKVYHLHTLINSNFNSLLFGHGEGTYSLYFQIDATNITFMSNGASGTVLTHGLTLDTYIDFMLVVGERNTGTVIMNTLGGTYTHAVQVVNGYNGDVFLRPVNCALGETSIVFSSADFRQPIWMFGDSYFTHTSAARWPYWLLEWGFGRCLLDGFPGANSDEILPQVKTFLGLWGIPKYICWCLGMNDPDNGAINATWLSCVNTLIAQCEKYGVTPILATIPNVPALNHTYKNEWVRESGYRYIDFAKAVGAEQAGSSWYAGALSADNTHPSEIGAKLLCQQALIDVPELTV